MQLLAALNRRSVLANRRSRTAPQIIPIDFLATRRIATEGGTGMRIFCGFFFFAVEFVFFIFFADFFSFNIFDFFHGV
jgi:hypothetical protein